MATNPAPPVRIVVPEHTPGSVSEGFGITERKSASEIAASSMQAEAMAAVQARYIVARQCPRDLVKFRANLLAMCRNPKFADEALYEKPVGGDEMVTDFSIRFAEAVVRFYGNLDVSTEATFDDPQRRKIRITATDLENNATFRADRMLEKTVERKYAGEDRTVIAQRLNSRRQKVFIVVATEEEFFTKEAAAASKLIRTNVMRFVDEDIKDECHKVIETTLKTAASNDPAARITRLVAAYAKFGVDRDKLNEVLGHPVEQATPDEIVQLTKHWVGLREGESWNDIREAMLAKRQRNSGTAPGAAPSGSASGSVPDDARASGASNAKSDALAEKLTAQNAVASDDKPTNAAAETGQGKQVTASEVRNRIEPSENATAGLKTQSDPHESTTSAPTNPNQPTGGDLFPSSPRDEHKEPRRSKRS